MSVIENKIKVVFEKEDTNRWYPTQSVQGLFGIHNNTKVIRNGDVRELRFELGGSPFTSGVTENNGRLYVYRNVIHEYVENKGDDVSIHSLINIGNQLNGYQLIKTLENGQYNREVNDDEYMTEDFLKDLCLISFGEFPYHIWTEGDEDFSEVV